MIAIILGPDAATSRAHLKRIAAERDPDGSNTSRLDGKSIRMGEAVSMVGTPSFLGSGRVIIVDDLISKSTRWTTDETSDEAPAKATSSPASDVSSLFKAVHPDNTLILAEQSFATLPSVISKLLPAGTEVVPSDPPRGHALIEWICSQAAKSGAAIERDAAQALAESLFPQTWSAKPSNPRFDRPPDLDQLSNELAKLTLFAHPEPVSVLHVRELAEIAASDRLFQFVEQTVAGNLANAIRDLEAFDLYGDDVHRVSSQLYQQIELATVLTEAPAKSDPASVGRDIGLSNPNRMFGIARAPRPALPAESVRFACEVDRGIKTGKLKDAADSIYALVAWFSEVNQDKTIRRGKS